MFSYQKIKFIKVQLLIHQDPLQYQAEQPNSICIHIYTLNHNVQVYSYQIALTYSLLTMWNKQFRENQYMHLTWLNFFLHFKSYWTICSKAVDFKLSPYTLNHNVQVWSYQTALTYGIPTMWNKQFRENQYMRLTWLNFFLHFKSNWTICSKAGDFKLSPYSRQNKNLP